MKRAMLLAACAIPAPTVAQTMRPTLDYASAATIRDTCLATARGRGGKVAVVVLEPHGMPVTLAQMDGVSMAGGEMARWKAAAAARFGHSTADIAKLDPPANAPDAATIAGGVPIYAADGTLLGGVGVSGGKPADDAACATAGIEAAGLKPAPPAQ